ncbi:MAG: hypothetical protein CMO80_11725 [Verrucomicrobiales bacterium]|nr:hypothetical protein [Verrucomicrobiales bacterium]|tara:strand:+ start:2535 stop:3311 length:777 start_codon:yes stop_codon:yes gene_type:complete
MIRGSFLLSLVLGLIGASIVQANTGSRFEEANRLFEKDDFPGAVQVYEGLVSDGNASVSLLFNLGNALFKSGEFGRAIYFYRQAERIAPRDPDVRANLQFTRKEVAGAFAPTKAGWKQFFHHLSEREWALLTAVIGALWFALLGAREGLQQYRLALVWPIRVMGALSILMGICCAVSRSAWSVDEDAVVIVEKANAHYGPLDDSKTAFFLKNGEEVRLSGEKGDWIQVTEAGGKLGWVRASELQHIAESISETLKQEE